MPKNTPKPIAYDIKIPVLIIGAGPAGLTASLALSRYGVSHILVDQFAGASHTPRAHITNQRTMEIFRDLGIEDAVTAAAAPADLMWSNAWITTMAGPEVMRSEAWGAGPEHRDRYRQASPCTMLNVAQHIVEPLMADAIKTIGIADFRYGHVFETFNQDEEGVTATIREAQTGTRYTIRADYMIGSDGARSRVADQLALPFDGHMGEGGDTGVGEVVYVWIKADLTRYCEHRPGAMFWQTDLINGATFIMVRPWNEWVVAWNLPVGAPLVEAIDPEAAKQRIAHAIGDPSVSIEIKNISRWKLNKMWALRYGKGRVWCVGDAVHRHPPMNGLGSNTSIADAYNLAWKLKLLLDGDGGQDLLATYEAERQPIGARIVNRAWNSTVAMFGTLFPKILGYRHGATPEEMARAIEIFRSDSPEGDERRAAFAQFRTEELDPAFNALGIELGYRYQTGAKIDDGTPEPKVEGHEDVEFVPTTWPGARLPHVWLEKGPSKVSSLDLVGKGRFVLLSGRGGKPWFEAARAVKHHCGISIEVILIDVRFGEIRDPLGHWARVRGVACDGAVLVRPDGHVAWRAESVSQSGELTDVMGRILGQTKESATVSSKRKEYGQLEIANG
jgi:2,4-dichlorophenol 6-monooxygenase